jgi:hypothetical protein
MMLREGVLWLEGLHSALLKWDEVKEAHRKETKAKEKQRKTKRKRKERKERKKQQSNQGAVFKTER